MKWNSIFTKLGGSILALVITQFTVVVIAVIGFVNVQDNFSYLSNETLPEIVAVSSLNNKMVLLSNQINQLTTTESQARSRLISDAIDSDIKNILHDLEVLKDSRIHSNLVNKITIFQKLKIKVNDTLHEYLAAVNKSSKQFSEISELLPPLMRELETTDYTSVQYGETVKSWFFTYVELSNLLQQMRESTRLYDLNRYSSQILTKIDDLTRISKSIPKNEKQIAEHLTRVKELISGDSGYVSLLKSSRKLKAKVSAKKNFSIAIIKDIESYLASQFLLLKEENNQRSELLSEEISDRTQLSILLLSFSVIFAIVVIYLLNRTIIKRLENLTSSLRSRTNNDLEELPETGNDEITDITRSINYYTHELAGARIRAEEGSMAKSEFLATMSHEIRTPMNGVLGMASILDTTELNQEQKECVDVIRQSGEIMLHVINDILDFSRLDAHQIELDSHEFNLQEITETIMNIFSHQADDKKLEFTVTNKGNAAQLLQGDSGRLQQVMMNLVGNAIKFTQDGYVRITTEVTDNDEDSCTVKFEVSDSGVGIKVDKLSSLFDSFVQADSSISRKYGGSGLGLAISKRLISLMNGTIQVQSAEGSGSVFSIELILPKVTESSTPSTKPDTSVTEKEVSRELSILLVEDVMTNQIVARKMIHKIGYKVEVANNGVEALDLVQSNTFDLILMDLQMPEMDGITATKHIRSQQDQLGHIPIIAMTANASDQDKNACMEAGMNDFLTKPINPITLQTILQKYE